VESVGVNLTVSGATEDEIFQDIDNLLNEIVNQAATDVTNKIVDEANKTLSELKVDSESTSNE
jgi:chorismate mutase